MKANSTTETLQKAIMAAVASITATTGEIRFALTEALKAFPVEKTANKRDSAFLSSLEIAKRLAALLTPLARNWLSKLKDSVVSEKDVIRRDELRASVLPLAEYFGMEEKISALFGKMLPRCPDKGGNYTQANADAARAVYNAVEYMFRHIADKLHNGTTPERDALRVALRKSFAEAFKE